MATSNLERAKKRGRVFVLAVFGLLVGLLLERAEVGPPEVAMVVVLVAIVTGVASAVGGLWLALAPKGDDAEA